jgi:endonuclease YncB( thermonuclease family)
MAQGLLRLRGTLALSTLWPAGMSDADTATLLVDAHPGSFFYKPSPGKPWRVTHAFEGARVLGRVQRPVIRKGKVSVRLQGADAAELHYMPPAGLPARRRSAEQAACYKAWSRAYRQPLAEEAILALRGLLGAGGRAQLSCEVFSAVDSPSEAFDTYGRLVGDVWVKLGGRKFCLNSWLLREGWAFPAFYSSMSRAELLRGLKDTEHARKGKRGVWGRLGEYVNRVGWRLPFRKVEEALAGGRSSGQAIPPKLFRRLAAWQVNRRSRMARGSFAAYLAARGDICFLTGEVLSQGLAAATPHALSDFVMPDGFFTQWPQNLVFQEAPSRLELPGGASPTW